MVATTTCRGASHSGKLAGIVLDQDADEALERAEDRAVQHHRPVPRTVLADIGGVEALGQHVVELQRAALPGAADGVLEVELELRAIEGALALGEDRSRSRWRRAHRPAPSRRGPRSRRAAELVRPRRELDDDVGQAHVAVDRAKRSTKRLGLVEDLVLAAEDVRVVLGHLPHAHAGHAARHAPRCGGSSRTRPCGSAGRGRTWCPG